MPISPWLTLQELYNVHQVGRRITSISIISTVSRLSFHIQAVSKIVHYREDICHHLIFSNAYITNVEIKATTKNSDGNKRLE